MSDAATPAEPDKPAPLAGMARMTHAVAVSLRLGAACLLPRHQTPTAQLQRGLVPLSAVGRPAPVEVAEDVPYVTAECMRALLYAAAPDETECCRCEHCSVYTLLRGDAAGGDVVYTRTPQQRALRVYVAPRRVLADKDAAFRGAAAGLCFLCLTATLPEAATHPTFVPPFRCVPGEFRKVQAYTTVAPDLAYVPFAPADLRVMVDERRRRPYVCFRSLLHFRNGMSANLFRPLARVEIFVRELLACRDQSWPYTTVAREAITAPGYGAPFRHDWAAWARGRVAVCERLLTDLSPDTAEARVVLATISTYGPLLRTPPGTAVKDIYAAGAAPEQQTTLPEVTEPRVVGQQLYAVLCAASAEAEHSPLVALLLWGLGPPHDTVRDAAAAWRAVGDVLRALLVAACTGLTAPARPADAPTPSVFDVPTVWDDVEDNSDGFAVDDGARGGTINDGYAAQRRLYWLTATPADWSVPLAEPTRGGRQTLARTVAVLALASMPHTLTWARERFTRKRFDAELARCRVRLQSLARGETIAAGPRFSDPAAPPLLTARNLVSIGPVTPARLARLRPFVGLWFLTPAVARLSRPDRVLLRRLQSLRVVPKTRREVAAAAARVSRLRTGPLPPSATYVAVCIYCWHLACSPFWVIHSTNALPQIVSAVDLTAICPLCQNYLLYVDLARYNVVGIGQPVARARAVVNTEHAFVSLCPYCWRPRLGFECTCSASHHQSHYRVIECADGHKMSIEASAGGVPVNVISKTGEPSPIRLVVCPAHANLSHLLVGAHTVESIYGPSR